MKRTPVENKLTKKEQVATRVSSEYGPESQNYFFDSKVPDVLVYLPTEQGFCLKFVAHANNRCGLSMVCITYEPENGW